MNIGDKVRLVHGREEGIIHAFLPGDVVEIEIEDGFRIPVLKKEIVTISPVESQRMVKDTVRRVEPSNVISPRQAPFAEKGIFMSFVAVNDQMIIMYLVNNTDYLLPYTISAIQEQRTTGLSGGALQPRTHQKVTELAIKDFESWPTFDFNVLYFREGNYPVPAALSRRIKCRAQSFYKSKGKVPVIGKEGYVYQLDDQVPAKEQVVLPKDLSADLKTSMLGGTVTPQQPLSKPAEVIDLHIEKLTDQYAALSNNAMLQMQLDTFEHNLEMAIANGMPEITFIHGVGAGKLKTELHRRLGKNQPVNYFKDALKDKFGYGATLVKFK